MKRMILIFGFVLLMFSLSYGQTTSRIIMIEILLQPDHPYDIMDYVTADDPDHTADYLLEATNQGVIKSSDDDDEGLRVCRFAGRAWVRIDQSMWPTAWPAFSSVYISLTYIPNGQTANFEVVITSDMQDDIYFYDDDAWVGVPPFIDDTLPVELSSFTAIVTAEMFVQLEWVAQTETNMLGYNVFRSQDENLNNSYKVNYVIISAHNNPTAVTYTYLDDTVNPGTTYYYWLQANDLDLTFQFHGPISVLVSEQDDPNIGSPVEIITKLKGAYPNPFNPGTNISFSLAESAAVTLTVYNIRGQLIRTLLNNQEFARGRNHSVYWDGKDHYNTDVASGVYFYIMQTDNDFMEVKKMMLMK